ncbi:MAG: metallophosphoesterase [Deltaproteobacteria bacterium]|nr:metallophosphoesterase [Deltaproteobacteria bacterium]
MIALAAALLAGCSVPPPELGVAPDVQVHQEDALRLIAIGDTGEDNASRRLVAEAAAKVCAERGCDLLLLLGDNLYPLGLSADDDPRFDAVMVGYEAVGVPVYGVMGNHDYGKGRDLEAAAHQLAWASAHPLLTMPTPAYRFRAGPAELFALDTTRAFWGDPTPQADWLREGLEASSARWRVVLGHHPYRSNGTHGNAGAYEGLAWAPYASGEGLERLFEGALCGRADLYLSGHDHNRQWLEACGVQLIVSGAGSKTTPITDRGNQTRFAEASEGLVWVELGAQMTVAFYDQRGALELEGVR